MKQRVKLINLKTLIVICCILGAVFIMLNVLFFTYLHIWSALGDPSKKIHYYSTPEIASSWSVGRLPTGATNIWHFGDLHRSIYECDISYEDFQNYLKQNPDMTFQKSDLPVRIARYKLGLRDENMYARLKDNFSSRIFHICRHGESYYNVHPPNSDAVVFHCLYDFDEKKMYCCRDSRGVLYHIEELYSGLDTENDDTDEKYEEVKAE